MCSTHLQGDPLEWSSSSPFYQVLTVIKSSPIQYILDVFWGCRDLSDPGDWYNTVLQCFEFTEQEVLSAGCQVLHDEGQAESLIDEKCLLFGQLNGGDLRL
jgi:hypothetical protein